MVTGGWLAAALLLPLTAAGWARSARPRCSLPHTEDSPYVQLRLRRPARANEEITADYGASYPYRARDFRR